MGDMKGRVALVTAGSKGLGAEVVRQLARRGADVAFTYKQDGTAAKAVVAEVQKLGRRCFSVRADAADFEKAHQVVSDIARRLGGLHILVCNAGIARAAALARMKESDWDDVMAVTLKGPFNYLHAAAPIFKKQNCGKSVCVGSINGLRGRMGTISYNVAKAGLVGLVKTAAAEMGRFNVNVNLVAPGFIESPSQAHTPELVRDLVLKECAIKRLAEPEDIAAVVVFLCSEAARHVTGQTIKVDAGQYL